MEFKEKVQELAETVRKQKPRAKNEEMTKMGLIVPFIRLLGYDPEDLSEVIPEFVADSRNRQADKNKQAEKVDYGICKDEGRHGLFLIECKHHDKKLDDHWDQLWGYFLVRKEVRFAILTNGVEYRFYTDRGAPNDMDREPFLQFNIMSIKDTEIRALKKFHKEEFDVDKILEMVKKLSSTTALRRWLEDQMGAPSEDFVRFVFEKACNQKGLQANSTLKQATVLLKETIDEYHREMIEEAVEAHNAKNAGKQDELKEQAEVPVKGQSKAPAAKANQRSITKEEREGLEIVKDIISKNRKLDVSLIDILPVKNERGDDGVVIRLENRFQPICRLFFQSNKITLELFDIWKSTLNGKKGQRKVINKVDDIRNFTVELLKTFDRYRNDVTENPSARK